MTTTIQAIDYSVNCLRAMLWQDDQQVIALDVLESKQAWYDANQSGFWEDWFTDVFDLRTANEFGCSVWAIILGISTTLILPPSDIGKPTFGFGTFNKNFNNGNFSHAQSVASLLTIEQKRALLRLRYLRLTTRCVMPEVNARLAGILGDAGLGTVYVVDNLNMTQTYFIGNDVSPALAFVLENFDVLPRPSAVDTSIFRLPPFTPFGFEAENNNFDNAPFLGD